MLLTPMVLDYLAGRHKCDDLSHPEGDVILFEGNVMRLERFCVTGQIMWETWLMRHFWNEVELGNIGLDPKKLFGWVN